VGLLAGIALGSFAAASAQEADSSAKTGQESRKNTIQLHRAESLLGLDVISSDGEKVGDIVDFAFQFDDQPDIRYFLVMSGGFLDMGGDVRAVPASTLEIKDDSAELSVETRQFERGPLVASDRADFFRDHQRVTTIDDHFRDSDTDLDSQRQSGRDDEVDYVLYSELDRDTVIGRNGAELGRVTDVWVSQEGNRALLVEIDPAIRLTSPFESRPQSRFQLPTSKFTGMGEDGVAYQFDIASDELADAESVTAIDRVTFDYGFGTDDGVIRIRVPVNMREQS
jgi:sporulation protein YlmC with PRC-barrel domain